MKRIKTVLTMFLILSLYGCSDASMLSQYNMGKIGYITYTDIDTVCDNHELSVTGADFLFSMKEQLLLSFVVDSSISITEELGDYDHLILTNPQWISRFGDPNKLIPVEYRNLSNSMQKFLDEQMPLWTVDGSVLPDGIGLYQYEEGKLLAFPTNVTFGMANPIEATNPLIILVDKPAQSLSANRCMLPLTSSGNILFTDIDELQTIFEASDLSGYGAVQQLKK